MTAPSRQLDFQQPGPHRNAGLWIARQFTAVLLACVIAVLIVASCAAIFEFVRTDVPRIVDGTLTMLAHPR